MRRTIVQLGHTKTVFLISLFSIFASVALYIPFGYLEGNLRLYGVLTAIFIPMIISPIVFWFMIKLIINIHNLETQMRELANIDLLTNVMSRRALFTSAQTLYALMQRNKSSLAILYIDIDNFKKINDRYGHSVGDKVLQDFGKVLNKHKRESDLIGRIGGEEFAFILPKTDQKGSESFAETLMQMVSAQVVEYEGTNISFTISIGVSLYNEHNKVNLNELIAQADKALYKAKHSGKHCTIVYKVND